MKPLTNLSVVLPAYNDEYSLPLILKKLIPLLPKISLKYEIIIVNDASIDKTLKVLKKIAKQHGFIKIFSHQKNQGYGKTLVDGFSKAKYDYIFYTDSDGQYNVAEIVKLTNAMKKNIDMVSGYKLNRADNFIRKFIGLSYNHLVKIIFNIKIKDVDCDFRLFRKRILKNLKIKSKSGTFDLEFIKKLENNKIIIKEVPVSHFKRKFGKSQFFKPKHLIKTFFDLLKLRFNIR